MNIKRVLSVILTIGALLLVVSGGRVQAGAHETAPLANTLASPLGVQFVHIATAVNTAGNSTYIDHPLTNNRPNAIIFVTQNYNPGGVGGTYNSHPIGVWYNTANNRWAIFNQDLAAMPVGAAFNVLIPSTDPAVFVHTATTGNIVGDTTFIDNALTNNQPNALLFVTPNYNPGGVGGTYNNHHIGVLYRSDRQKCGIFNQDYAAMPVNASFNVLVTTGAPAFVHRATAANIYLYITYIDHPLANGNPNAIVHITQNYNPGGVSPRDDNHPLGVWYDSVAKKWAIFNQDFVAMPVNTAFNVLIIPPETGVFVHRATAANTLSNSTYIDHPLTNGRPNALLFVTPSLRGVVFNNHPIGVWYTGSQWAILNLDYAPMPIGVTFNVWVPPMDTAAFVHTATAASIDGSATFIDHPLTKNRPTALLFVTPNYNPGGVGGIAHNHRIGVSYNTLTSRWGIYNQDWTVMDAGPAFNVWVAPSGAAAFVHTSASGNLVWDSTVIDSPLTNNRPAALLFVTQNYNPGGVGGAGHNRNVGVNYSGTRWTIFNQDQSDMPSGVSFNVFVTSNKVYLPLVLKMP